MMANDSHIDPLLVEDVVNGIEHLKEILLEVATGGTMIQDVEEEYQDRYDQTELELERLREAGIPATNPNEFRSLWDWYHHWDENLPSYADRRRYVHQLYQPLLRNLELSLRKHREDPRTSLAEDLSKRFSDNEETRPASPPWIDSLHPKLADRCGSLLEKGEPEDLIHKATKVVEDEVRRAANAEAEDIGRGLMAKAFGEDPPLLTVSDVEAEQQGAFFLYAGAIGFLKNPRSHRFVEDDVTFAREALAFASMLLRLLDEVENTG